MKKSKSLLTSGCILFLLFVAFTVVVKLVDVYQYSDAEYAKIGLWNINNALYRLLSMKNADACYNISEILGYAAIGIAFGFALFALVQLIKGKSLKAVDAKLYALGGFYVVVVGFYALFEVLVINYRPEWMMVASEEIESSYPSSHTVLAVCIFASAMIMFARYFKEKAGLLAVLDIICGVCLVATIVTRWLSGVHWFTDIIGGLFLAASLVSLFAGTIAKLEEK